MPVVAVLDLMERSILFRTLSLAWKAFSVPEASLTRNEAGYEMIDDCFIE